MKRRTKNLFEDYYGSAHPATQAVPDGPKGSFGPRSALQKPAAPKVVSETEDHIEVQWTDVRTGAEYRVKERKPAGPQGDFRAYAAAENRYKSIMGLPDGGFGPSFHESRPDDPFAEDRLAPEPVASQAEIEDRIRERVAGDTKRQQAMMATRESAVFEDDWRPVHNEGQEDEAFMDPHGRIHERPANTIGPYGTERERHYEPAKTTREADHKPAAHGIYTGAERPMDRSDALEERLRQSRGLEVILTAAFRGLFGSMVADHITTRSEMSDRRHGFERPVITHILQDYGLLKPLKAADRPSGHANSDKPQKPENLDYAVGLRAIAAIPKGPEAPDLADLPGAEREALITAVGRTVLHAMTLIPAQQESDRPVPDGLQTRQLEIKKMIASALKPDILRGLVPSELIANADRRYVDSVAKARAGGSALAIVPVQRQTSEALEERPRKPGPVAGRATVGQFAEFGVSARRTVRKQLFDTEAASGEAVVPFRPISGSGAFQHSHGATRPSQVRVRRERVFEDAN